MSEEAQSWEAAYGCTLTEGVEWHDGYDFGHVLYFDNPEGRRVAIVVSAGPGPSYGVRAVVGRSDELPTSFNKRVSALVPAWHSDLSMDPEVL